MSEIEKIAQGADFIVNGYSFFCQDSMVRVLNLNNPASAAVLSKNGDILETSMDDIELSIVQKYWEKNKEFVED